MGKRDTVVLQTSDGKLVALERTDGTKRWTFDTQVPILTLRGTGTPVLEREVCSLDFNWDDRAVDLKTGAPVWEQRVMLPQGRSELDRMVDVDGSPLTAGILLRRQYQGRLKAIRANDGAVVWEIEARRIWIRRRLRAGLRCNRQRHRYGRGPATGTDRMAARGSSKPNVSSPLAFGNYSLSQMTRDTFT
ncbi:MAG: hypothetical protein Ct9H300mP8_05120 [Gammaproteobacteria bacterium]|nr:MAG: hypothetical protein Ct9H300mP8_05120 [Gammaproteobacteria bacterium]